MRAGDPGGGAAARTVLLVAATAVLAVGTTLGVLYVSGALASQARQEEVARKGTEVMPFDVDRTTHVFETTESGGVQEVVADDPADREQVVLVREHLREEAEAFERGDFSDPAEIHGEDMPGLKELKADASRIEVRYAELPDGARITYTTADPRLVLPLHEWFAAQLSDHGDDASPGGGEDHSSRH